MIKLDATSESMNLITQMFETPKNATAISKLEFIDTGYWTHPDPATGAPRGAPVKIVFVGKMVIDTTGLPCFVNIFTF